MATAKGTLAGKVAIVTGGGTGLGKAIALALAQEGADIVVAARREPPIEETAREVKALGPRALAVPTDVTDSQQVNRLIERTLSEMGRIDILVNNAGIVRGQQRKPFWEITDAEWRLNIDTNFSSAFYCCRAVGKYFVDQKRGKIINVASGNGIRAQREDYMYGSAKAGLIQLTRILAMTWAQNNIQVNCIAPGFIDTRAFQPGPVNVAVGRHAEFIPVGRFGIPWDIGYLGLFLASDASDYITGAVFVCDGGGLAGGIAPTGYARVIPLKEDWHGR